MTRPNRILRLRTVLERTGLSRSTLYRKIRGASSPRRFASRNAASAGERATSSGGSKPAYYSRSAGADQPRQLVLPFGHLDRGGGSVIRTPEHLHIHPE